MKRKGGEERQPQNRGDGKTTKEREKKNRWQKSGEKMMAKSVDDEQEIFGNTFIVGMPIFRLGNGTTEGDK